MERNSAVRGRFAPSPSGYMHLGNAMSALISWLDVKCLSGEMVLRIEDLDPDRSRSLYIEGILSDIEWLGLTWDEGPPRGGQFGPYFQSQRRQIYETILARLTEERNIYPCYCSRSELRDASAPHVGEREPVYSGKCRGREIQQEAVLTARRPALRLAVPDKTISFSDLNYGLMNYNLQQDCGDFIVRRSDGVHAYQLAVSVDDALMGINRVVRGSDLLDSTPRQLYIHQLLGKTAPEYGHVPLLLGEDGRRLSKRHNSVELRYWRERGVAPQRLIGYLAWKAGLIDRLTAVSAKELIADFRWELLKKNAITVLDDELNALEAR